MDLDMRREMPFDMHFLYVYRQPLKSITSWLRMTNQFNIDAKGLASNIPGLGKLYPNILVTADILKVLKFRIRLLKSITSEKWQDKYSWLEGDDFSECDLHFVQGECHGQADHVEK
jgi:hypothetical protein